MEEEVNKLVERIQKETELSRDEITKKIENKEEEYSGLISKEGAAHIVAKESGVELLKQGEKSLDIDNIVSGMNNVNITGKIVRIFEPREFETDDGKGKVANIILADETGRIRTSLWNEQVEKLIEEDRIEEGQTIEIQKGYVKKDNRDNLELRLGRSGQIKKSGEEIDVEVSSGGEERGEMDIEELSPGDSGEIKGTLVNLFGDDPFFKTCPECGNRVEDECEEHGESQVNLAISGVLDDGTGSIRSVFFREQAEKLIGMKTEEAWESTDKGESMDPFLKRCNEVLGEEFAIDGRVKMNDFFGRPEFIANSVEELDPRNEAKEIISGL